MHYNNYHPILEGMILERVTGMPVAKYLEKTIWQPLGMEFRGFLEAWTVRQPPLKKWRAASTGAPLISPVLACCFCIREIGMGRQISFGRMGKRINCS